MDYMDLDIWCLRKAVKLNQSLTLHFLSCKQPAVPPKPALRQLSLRARTQANPSWTIALSPSVENQNSPLHLWTSYSQHPRTSSPSHSRPWVRNLQRRSCTPPCLTFHLQWHAGQSSERLHSLLASHHLKLRTEIEITQVQEQSSRILFLSGFHIDLSCSFYHIALNSLWPNDAIRHHGS